ncbi:MAG: chemotaxis protein [Velocimicrobium sp.]
MSEPKRQTIASKKYQEKIGLVPKTYKLKKEIVEDFAKACDKASISQAAQLTKMMQEFSKQHL